MNLLPVILWLDNGCDPHHAANELRIIQKRIDDERHHEIVRVTKLEEELAASRAEIQRLEEFFKRANRIEN